MSFNILKYFRKKWDEYQKQKRSDALWNKLHRYHEEGKPCKFKPKEAWKAGQEAIKERKKKYGKV